MSDPVQYRLLAEENVDLRVENARLRAANANLIGHAEGFADDRIHDAAEVERLRESERQARSVIALHQQNGCGVQLYAEGLRAEIARLRGQVAAQRKTTADEITAAIDARLLQRERAGTWTMSCLDGLDEAADLARRVGDGEDNDV
jgi:hypothetical protein